MKKKICEVISNYRTPFKDPLILKKGEILNIEKKTTDYPGWIWCRTKTRKKGWVPVNYILIDKDKAKLLQDYNATELDASVGEKLTIEKQESGWAWVRTRNGKRGWIPLENVKIIGKK